MPTLIRVFSIISLIFLSTSCKHLKVDGERVEVDGNVFEVPYFNEDDKDYLYSAKIIAYGNEMSGLLVIKKIGHEHKRLALLTDFGNTLLDMEFVNEEIKINYVVEDLDRKLILNQLKKNFQLLLHSKYLLKQRYKIDEGEVLTSEFQKKHVFLHVSEKGYLKKLIQAGTFKKKAEINYSGENKTAELIHFTSNKLPLEVILRKKVNKKQIEGKE